MDRQIVREDARSLLFRAGLSVSDERLDGLAKGLQAARAAAVALSALKMGYRGPVTFQAPPLEDARRAHAN